MRNNNNDGWPQTANEATDAGLTTTTSAIVVVRASGNDPIAPSSGKDDDDDSGRIDDAPPAVEKDATMDNSYGSTGKRGSH